MTASKFFEEFRKIIASQPRLPTDVLNSENCDYGSSIYYSKNLYHAFSVDNSRDSAYITDAALLVNCFDTDHADQSELCYECVDVTKCYNCEYLEDCSNMRDSAFCVRCDNCHDVFGCVELQNKAFCIFNRQLSEQEYKEKVKEYRKLPAEKVLAYVYGELKKRFPLTQTHEEHNVNSSYGNYLYHNKNVYLSFDAHRNEDSAYIYDSVNSKGSYDVSFSGENELSYEIVDSANCYNSSYVMWSKNIQDSSYVFNCSNLKNCLGCVGIDHRQYCILNRQLTKEDYERIRAQIWEELKKEGFGWDELFY